MAGPAGQSDQNGNGGRVEKAAENAMLKLLARWMMVTGIPAIIAAGLWVGREVITATNANTLATVRLEGKVETVTVQFGGELRAHADKLRSLEDRNIQQDQRMDRTDTKIETMQQRLWQTPVLPARQPEEQQRQQWQQR